MAQNDYTCFIISPIGNEFGSDTQKQIFAHSKTVLEYLILPTLRIAGFQESNIIRVDMESQAGGKITDSMERHLREDELCIADLTGLNPNVMYEYGMRVGIGKPIIAISSDDLATLPFDVNHYHTIRYDVSTVPGLMRAQKDLEKQVSNWIAKGFQPKTGTGSFTELSRRLANIEKRLAQIIANGSNNTVEAEGNATEVIRKLGSSTSAFNYALRTRDIKLGEQLMPRLKAEMDPKNYIDVVVAQLAAMGSRRAGEELKDNWNSIVVNQLTLKQQYEEIGCYISYCNRADLEIEEFKFVSDELKALEERIENSTLAEKEKAKLRAGVLNQTNRFYHGAYSTVNLGSDEELHRDWLETAIEALKNAVQLNPNEASYYYNLAICQLKAGNNAEALDSIDKCLKISKEDSDHLRLAYKIYIEAHEADKAKDVKEKLQSINPYAAAML